MTHQKNKTNVENDDEIMDNEAKGDSASDRGCVHVISDHAKNENTNDNNTSTMDKTAALKNLRNMVKTVIKDNKGGKKGGELIRVGKKQEN